MTDKYFLTDIITKADVRAMEKSIKPHTVNASELGDLCPRYHFYACQHKDQYLCSGIIDSALSVTFEMGKALEHSFRVSFLKTLPITTILANWVIRDHIPIQRQDMVSEQWNHELQKFELCEFRLGLTENTLADFREVRYSDLITGRVDWMYIDKNEKITICELKTINKTQFDALKNPLLKHAVQDLCYIRLAHEDPKIKALGLGLNFEGKLFYTCKDFRRRTDEEKITKESSMYKEYTVDFIEYKAIMKDRWDAAQEAVTAATTGVCPEGRLCKTFLKGRGKQCPFVVRCFMGD